MGRAGVRSLGLGFVLICSLLPAVALLLSGCRTNDSPAAQNDTHNRLQSLFNLYRLYVEKNHRGPPNEEALREFHQKLSSQERADRTIADDLEGIFVSPRDKQKFVVQYNVNVSPAKNQALAWEATGQNGMRWVALTMGYVVEYDEKMLNEAKK
jgi:hypothetical protein